MQGQFYVSPLSLPSGPSFLLEAKGPNPRRPWGAWDPGWGGLGLSPARPGPRPQGHVAPPTGFLQLLLHLPLPEPHLQAVAERGQRHRLAVLPAALEAGGGPGLQTHQGGRGRLKRDLPGAGVGGGGSGEGLTGLLAPRWRRARPRTRTPGCGTTVLRACTSSHSWSRATGSVRRPGEASSSASRCQLGGLGGQGGAELQGRSPVALTQARAGVWPAGRRH